MGGDEVMRGVFVVGFAGRVEAHSILWAQCRLLGYTCWLGWAGPGVREARSPPLYLLSCSRLQLSLGDMGRGNNVQHEGQVWVRLQSKRRWSWGCPFLVSSPYSAVTLMLLVHA